MVLQETADPNTTVLERALHGAVCCGESGEVAVTGLESGDEGRPGRIVQNTVKDLGVVGNVGGLIAENLSDTLSMPSL